MCTLIAFHRVWNDAPLVVAVNRDEAYERPSRPPEWIDGSRRILAPRDERAGGTWMGASESGLWVGITNRHEGDTEPGRRSRGLLCLDLLEEDGPEAVVDRIESLEEPYDPFHLVTGDGRSLWRLEYDAGKVRVQDLSPGCHVVTNRPLDDESGEPKVERVWTLLRESRLWSGPARDEPPTDQGDAPPDPVDAPADRNAPADLEARLGGILADHGRGGPTPSACTAGSTAPGARRCGASARGGPGAIRRSGWPSPVVHPAARRSRWWCRAPLSRPPGQPP